ncbi:hypothetical protein ACFU9X_35645 [Streptomyces atratus]|uniref:hypothetical protein n=1 Tax=Streptomyces atratus TaxID=1893 RepID=UPI0036A6D7AC
MVRSECDRGSGAGGKGPGDAGGRRGGGPHQPFQAGRAGHGPQRIAIARDAAPGDGSADPLAEPVQA